MNQPRCRRRPGFPPWSERGLIDAHVHVWSADRLRYPFGPHDELPLPGNSATAGDFFAERAGRGVRAVLLIQPRLYGYDHAYLFDTAAQLGRRARVMPLVNVTRSTTVQDVRRLAGHPATAGFRVIALGPRPARWLCSPEAHLAWEAACHLNLPVGLLVDPHQIPLLAQVAAAHPGLTIIVDHAARCAPALQREHGPALLGLASFPDVHVKVSALCSLSDAPFPYPDMWALIGQLYREFGARRLLWGSDWPHTRRQASHVPSYAAVAEALAHASERDLEAIVTTTAAGLFGFDLADVTGGNP